MPSSGVSGAVCEHAFPMTSQGHAYARFRRALKTGNAHIALAAAAELRQVGLADALSLLLLIREDKPVLYDKAAVRWFAKYAGEDRYLLLRDARELVDLLDGVGRHDQVAVVRLERWLRARGYDDEADRVA
jgi:hypothetical protein